MIDISQMSNIAAMKGYFEMNGGKKITIHELKPLSHEDKKELGDLARAELLKT